MLLLFDIFNSPRIDIIGVFIFLIQHPAPILARESDVKEKFKIEGENQKVDAHLKAFTLSAQKLLRDSEMSAPFSRRSHAKFRKRGSEKNGDRFSDIGENDTVDEKDTATKGRHRKEEFEGSGIGSEANKPNDWARPDIDGAEELNPFVENRFHPDYPIHNLCGPWSSGRQTSELEWSEPADKLLRIIGASPAANGASGYNMFLAPGQGNGQWRSQNFFMGGTTTNVSVAIYIESMSSFRAQTMDFEVDMYLAMGWYDRRLSHNCTHPILVTHKFIAERIWTPDLYFLNSKFAYLQEVTTPNFMAIIYPDGLVFKSMRTDVTLSCMMDLQMFPMDEQECPLLIQSYAYVENLVTLNWLVDPPTYPIARNPDLKLNDMSITGTKYERCSGPYEMFRGTGNWSCIRGLIVMKRLVLFHLIQTYIPTGMLVSVSWMTFWLDARASPARISLTITSLLTLTTMSNGARQDLPQVSYVKAMDIWQTFSQALIFLVLLEYSFVSYYFTRRTFNCVHLCRKMRNRAQNSAASKLARCWQKSGRDKNCFRKISRNNNNDIDNYISDGSDHFVFKNFECFNRLCTTKIWQKSQKPSYQHKCDVNENDNEGDNMKNEKLRSTNSHYHYHPRKTNIIGNGKGYNYCKCCRPADSGIRWRFEGSPRFSPSLSNREPRDVKTRLSNGDSRSGAKIIVLTNQMASGTVKSHPFSTPTNNLRDMDDTVTDEGDSSDESDFLMNNGLISSKEEEKNDLTRIIRLSRHKNNERAVRFRQILTSPNENDSRGNDVRQRRKGRDSIFNYHEDTTENENENDSGNDNSKIRIRPCKHCRWRDEQMGRDIDYYSRYAFPGMFTVFTVVYWLYFSWYRRAATIYAP